jgi:hypothetical protein
MHFFIIIEQKIIPFLNDSLIHFSKGEILVLSNIWTDDISITIQSNLLLIETESLAQYLKTTPGALVEQDLAMHAKHGFKVLTTYMSFIKSVILSIEEAIKLIKLTENINVFIEKQIELETLLNDPYELRDFLINLIDLKQREMEVLDESIVLDEEPSLKPEFMEYITRHGPPGKDGFDLHLMEHIITDLKKIGIIKSISLSNATIEKPFADIIAPAYIAPTKSKFIKGHDYIDSRGKHIYHNDESNTNIGLDHDKYKQTEEEKEKEQHSHSTGDITKNDFIHDKIGEDYTHDGHDATTHTHDSETAAIIEAVDFNPVYDSEGNKVYDEWGRLVFYDEQGIRWGKKYNAISDSICKFCNTNHGFCKSPSCKAGMYVVQFCDSKICNKHCHGVCNKCGHHNYDTSVHEYHNAITVVGTHDMMDHRNEDKKTMLQDHVEQEYKDRIAPIDPETGNPINTPGHGHSEYLGELISGEDATERQKAHIHVKNLEMIYPDIRSGREGTQCFWVHTEQNMRDIVFEPLSFSLLSISTNVALDHGHVDHAHSLFKIIPGLPDFEIPNIPSTL